MTTPSEPMSTAGPEAGSKAALRAAMRSMRKALPDRRARSEQIWLQLQQHPSVTAAHTVMAFTNVPGEPETASFIDWCRRRGKTVVLPEDEPTPDPALVDVVVVPGIAFTVGGDRLGQGGGWYDRFLAGIRSDATTIGVAFAEQVVESLPVEPHDRKVDQIITA